LPVTSFRAGISPKIVSERLGHTNVAFTMRTYMHVIPGMDAAAADEIAALIAVALTAQILVVLDTSVVNTALPSIGRSLTLDSGQLQWLVTAYLMMSGGGLLLGGRIADLMSRRTVFLTGLAVFTFASLVSGFASNGTELIAARAAQGSRPPC
jgi:predicted MFS family arabinose efflux permease